MAKAGIQSGALHSQWRAKCRGRDDHRCPPPAQICTCAFTHTALTEDEWRRSAYRDRDAERGVEEPTGPAVARDDPMPPARVDCDESKRSATIGTTPPEDTQLSRVTGYRVVLVVALHNLPEPCADFTRAMMLPVLKLCLHDIELRNHPLLRRNPPDVEGSAAREVSTEM